MQLICPSREGCRRVKFADLVVLAAFVLAGLCTATLP